MSSDRRRPPDRILTSETQIVPRGALGTKFHVKKGFPVPELNVAKDALVHFVANEVYRLCRLVQQLYARFQGFREQDVIERFCDM